MWEPAGEEGGAGHTPSSWTKLECRLQAAHPSLLSLANVIPVSQDLLMRRDRKLISFFK